MESFSVISTHPVPGKEDDQGEFEPLSEPHAHVLHERGGHRRV